MTYMKHVTKYPGKLLLFSGEKNAGISDLCGTCKVLSGFPLRHLCQIWMKTLHRLSQNQPNIALPKTNSSRYILYKPKCTIFQGSAFLPFYDLDSVQVHSVNKDKNNLTEKARTASVLHVIDSPSFSLNYTGRKNMFSLFSLFVSDVNIAPKVVQ